MSVLGMTLLGSRGNTRAQLSSVLKLNHSDEAVKDAFSAVIQKYKVRLFTTSNTVVHKYSAGLSFNSFYGELTLQVTDYVIIQ